MPNQPVVDVAILTVLPEEYKSVYGRLSHARPLPPPPPAANLYAWVSGAVPLQQGSEQAYSIALGMTGRAGTSSGALATIDATTCWKPRYVFFVGIAGGFALNGLQMGDVVVADLIYGYEYGKLEKVFQPRSNWVYRPDLALVNSATAFYTTHPDWASSIQVDHPAKGTPRVFTGQVASGDKVVDDPSNEFFAQVQQAWPKLKAVEMEGVGAAAAIEYAQSKGMPVGFLMIRGISDMPAPPEVAKEVRGTQERDFWKPYAANAAAAFTVSCIAHGLPLPPRGATRLASTEDPAEAFLADAEDALLGPAAVQPPGAAARLGPSSGSPFVIGRPLRADEPIFGRGATFRFIAGELDKFSSVNVVGERRMGKTSVLNHLVDRQDNYLVREPDQPPLVLAYLDLQGRLPNETRFYGLALRKLLDNLPPSRSREARAFQDWRERLHAQPEADYDEFRRGLRRLRDQQGVCVCPVLILDEFERLLEKNFSYPDFFNGVRALITAELLAMVIASRLPLAEYFRRPARPQSLTSTFPNYFTPFELSPLDDEASDALLLQPSEHPLTVKDAAEAKRWAKGHPCHLQVAGQAWYEARAEGHASKWAVQRFNELRRQSCMTGQAKTRRYPKPRWLGRGIGAIFWHVPLSIGRLAQRLGARVDDVAARIIGAVVILLLSLVLLGVVRSDDLVGVIKKGLGLE